MLCRKLILQLIIVLAGILSAAGQQSIFLSTEENNLGKKLDIPVLAPAMREALVKEGYSVEGTESSQPYVLQLKVSTRQGSESQGIFTSFADVSITLKGRDGKVVDEKSIIGLKGAGLSYDHAGIDAIKKSSSKVLPEAVQILNAQRDKLTLAPTYVSQTADAGRSVDAMPPEITISSPLLFRNAFVETANPVMKIEGKVTDSGGILKLMINDYPVPVSSSGAFQTEIPVNEGVTQVIVLAEDQSHNQASRVFSVSRSAGAQPSPIASDLASGIGEYFALLIGINDYEDPRIPSLDNPINDAEALYESLTGYYTFKKENVVFLRNPGRDQIIIALDGLTKKISKADNLLIFYAGHGLWDTKKRLGYWLPADAKTENTAKWILNSTIKDIIASIQAKHTLLIADACFSGSIFKTRRAFNDAPPSIEKLYDLTSRKAMTSGTLTDVPDKSVFIEYLIKRLRENSQQYLSSEQLFTSFRETVMNNSTNTTPQYGVIQETGDDGGDFIFIRKSAGQ